MPVARGNEGYTDKTVKLFETLTACAGTYTTKGDSVLHHVEVCKAPDWVGTDQPRLVRLNGDTLSLRTQPIVSVGDGKLYVYVLVWKRGASAWE